MCPTAFFNRFALPHSLEAEGLKKKVAYYYSENPIEWYGSKVNLVIMFVTTKYDEEFSTVFDLIFEVLLDNNLYHQLTSCDVFEKVIDFLSEEFWLPGSNLIKVISEVKSGFIVFDCNDSVKQYKAYKTHRFFL